MFRIERMMRHAPCRQGPDLWAFSNLCFLLSARAAETLAPFLKGREQDSTAPADSLSISRATRKFEILSIRVRICRSTIHLYYSSAT